ncbi:MAG: alpha/beta hydrolase [Angustibacter sp.]
MTAAPAIRLLAQRQDVDEETVDELVAGEAAALGVEVRTMWVDDLGCLGVAVQQAIDAAELLLVLTAPGEPDLQTLGRVGEQRVLRLDVAAREPDLTPGLVAHLQGRGVWGVVWALRALHHRRRHVVHHEAYGERRDQVGELRLPEGDGPFPVVTVLHGGFWRSCWQLDLMDAVSIDLAARGIASWNVEYRRPDRHGWRATVQDVRRSLDHLHELARRRPLDLDRVAVVGHSAGGSMAVQLAGDAAAARVPHLRLAVQLAGLVDLVGTHRRDIGNGAVVTALGGTPEERPQVYAQASPLERVPVGVPQVVVVGLGESPDLREMSRRYVRAARAAGDDVTLVEDAGDHFTVIDPASVIWQRTAELIAAALR